MQEEFSRKIPIEDPLSRSARSWWLVLVPAVMFLAWAGSFFFAAEDRAFMGTPISSDHDSLKKDCGACHQKGRGVPSDYCSSEECHFGVVNNNLHETLTDQCVKCHPEHWRGEPIPKRMTDKQCGSCHEAIWKKDGKPEWSRVGREIFSHAPHRRNYSCATCHSQGENTLNVPREKLFKMDTCTICHEESQCMVCHSYHDKKTVTKPQTQGSDTAGQ